MDEGGNYHMVTLLDGGEFPAIYRYEEDGSRRVFAPPNYYVGVVTDNRNGWWHAWERNGRAGTFSRQEGGLAAASAWLLTEHRRWQLPLVTLGDGDVIPDRNEGLRRVQILRDYMSDISEEHTCCGWQSGLEYDLWDLLHGKDRVGPFALHITAGEQDDLRYHAVRAQGWCGGDGFYSWQAWIEHLRSTPEDQRHFLYAIGMGPGSESREYSVDRPGGSAAALREALADHGFEGVI